MRASERVRVRPACVRAQRAHASRADPRPGPRPPLSHAGTGCGGAAADRLRRCRARFLGPLDPFHDPLFPPFFSGKIGVGTCPAMLGRFGPLVARAGPLAGFLTMGNGAVGRCFDHG